MGGRDNGPEVAIRLPTPPQQPGASARGTSAHRRRCAGHARDVAKTRAGHTQPAVVRTGHTQPAVVRTGRTQPGAVGFNVDWTWPYQGEPWRHYLGRAWPA